MEMIFLCGIRKIYYKYSIYPEALRFAFLLSSLKVVPYCFHFDYFHDTLLNLKRNDFHFIFKSYSSIESPYLDKNISQIIMLLAKEVKGGRENIFCMNIIL